MTVVIFYNDSDNNQYEYIVEKDTWEEINDLMRQMVIDGEGDCQITGIQEILQEIEENV